MNDFCIHRIVCKEVTAVRERIERKLDVETKAMPVGSWSDKWAVTFYAPCDVNLDFLKPDVLEP